MRRACVLVFWVAVLVLAGGVRAAPVVINFDDLNGGGYLNGTPVPASDRLDIQLRATDGITFDSRAGYVAVVDLGAGRTTSGATGIGGASPPGVVDYTAPITFTFSDPANPFIPATTNFFSVRGDPIGSGASVTVTAYDASGAPLANNTQVDNGGETWSFSNRGIHSLRYAGAPDGNAGIGLDDVTFNPVTPALPGDANVDGTVNLTDLLIVAQNWGQPGGWINGNFNDDPTVDFSDLLTLGQHYGQSNGAAGAGAVVPEPASAVLLGVGLLAPMRRFRR